MTWPLAFVLIGTMASGVACFALIVRDNASRRLDDEARKYIENQAKAMGELQKQIGELRVKVGWKRE